MLTLRVASHRPPSREKAEREKNKQGGQGRRRGLMMIGQRYRYMDSLRAALIVGGVFYHAALAYMPDSHWIVEDPSGLRIFGYISGLLQAFRMPAFFFVAGFFCALGFSQRDVDTALKRRLMAFGIPLLCMALLVQPIQFALELNAHGKPVPGMSEFAALFVTDGKYVSHLWFLLNLIFYYGLCWVVVGAVRSHKLGLIRRLAGRKNNWVQSKLLLAVLSSVFTLLVNVVITRVDHMLGVVLDDLALYFPFFLAGYVGFVSKHMLERLSKIQWTDWVIASVLLVALTLIDVRNHTIAMMFEMLSWYLKAWLGSMLAVYLARRYLDVENMLLRKVSEASYSIYLFHHIVVGALVVALAGTALPGGYLMKYAVVVCGTVLITYTLHHRLIARIRLLKAMFNGNLDGFRATKQRRQSAQPYIRPSA